MGAQAGGSNLAVGVPLASEQRAQMTQTRVAAGVAAALLVVGAVVHFQPAHKLSAESFVSAALNIDTLAACKATAPSTVKAGGTPNAVINTDKWDGTAAQYVEKDGPCVCKKSICTNGRVCNAAGATGQCYLPRCPPAGTNVFVAYTAGCFCADLTVFTSSDKAAAFVGSPLPTATCTDGAVATENCQCGTTRAGSAFCYKGQTCTASAVGACDTVATQFEQEYAYAVPSISSNAFTDATKFAICKSTAATTRQCILPTAPPPTQEGKEATPTCKVQ